MISSPGRLLKTEKKETSSLLAYSDLGNWMERNRQVFRKMYIILLLICIVEWQCACHFPEKSSQACLGWCMSKDKWKQQLLVNADRACERQEKINRKRNKRYMHTWTKYKHTEAYNTNIWNSFKMEKGVPNQPLRMNP
jgi:hypothetical protein